MYSVMLAAMLTTGADTTQWGCFRCHGCHGRSSCHGCYVYNAFSCHSFCSGCSRSCSCYRSCHGCSGVVVVVGGCHGCHGCSGCWVSSHCCHSGGIVVAQPRQVIQLQVSPQPGGPRGPGGAMGPGGGGMMMGGGGMAGMAPGLMPRNDAERKAVEDLLRRLREGMGDKKGFEKKEFKEFKREEQKRDEASLPGNKARVVVSLPADARLWVDQVECPLPGVVRSFDTPNLDPQQSYSYTLRIAVQRNGQVVQDSRRVQLTPG